MSEPVSEEFPLPENLPVPDDDGAAEHLPGMEMPGVSLPATDGTTVEVAQLPSRSVIYVYPLTGRPDGDVIPEGWEDVPGARGCTPESRGFRRHYDRLRENGVERLYGLSTQSSAYQREARDRLDLPFEILSDAGGELTARLELPTFTVGGEAYLERLTLVISGGGVEHVFHPVFPPDEHASEVLEWVADTASRSGEPE